jgi:hypothetical protein
MINSDNELIESLRELVTQQSTPPPGWEDDLIRRIRETPVRPSIVRARSRQGRQAHKRWRPVLAEVGAALAIAAVIVLSIQGFFHPGTRSTLNGPVASPRTPGIQWVVQDFHGAGLVVTLDHPTAWRSQLQPQSLHYIAIFGYLANFPLPQFCTHPSASSFECKWSNVVKIPSDGVLVTFGTEGYGPLPDQKGQLLSQGMPTTVDGRRAAELSDSVSVCLGGIGPDHQLTLWIDDGRPAGVFDISFCWRGSDPSVAADVNTVVTQLKLRPDPTNAGPFPS